MRALRCRPAAAAVSRPVRPCAPYVRPRLTRPVRTSALPDTASLSELHQHTSALMDLADSAATAAAATADSSSSSGFLSPLTDTLETVLKTFQSQLNKFNVPYSYGWSIVLLTLCVKVVTLPLTKKQVESSLAVQSLKPRVDMIKARYGDEKEKIQRETNLLYEQAGVNPLAGCLPSLATIPIFIGLYRSLTNAANEGLFDTEGFLWIPSLAGPTTMAANKAGSGTAWLYPLVDGQPPIGWHDAALYCVLPVLLVLCQYVSSAVISPPIDPNAENANQQKVIYALLPMMIGWFALNVPSGLGLYYLSNTVLTTLIQVWLRKLGGAEVKVNELGPVTKVATARRLGPAATDAEVWTPPKATAATAVPEGDAQQQVMQQQLGAAQAEGSSSSSSGVPTVYYATRKRRASATA